MGRNQQYQETISRVYDGLSLFEGASPVIGISGNFRDSDCTLAKGYYQSIVQAGGTPVIIPPFADAQLIASLLERVDGILLSGGADIDPDFLGQEKHPTVSVNPERDLPEMLLIRLACDRQIPILGICRGIQMLAAALGGKLYQDIVSQHDKALVGHDQSLPRYETSHTVNIEPDSLLARLYGKRQMQVNSFHHQAVMEAPAGFRVTATAPDGIIEAMESTTFRSIIGVQWHPECMILNDDRSMMPIFDWFVNECRSYSQARSIHRRVLTLDSHCDTPMLFDEGAHFQVRKDGEPLVSLHKMRDGYLDASFMVAYLKQMERDADSLKAATAKADRILDLIEERIGECKGYASVARTPEDLYRLKKLGQKAIVLGIENGYAIGSDISNVERFRNRGVAYMTLCHNGDNDICDSAKGLNEHDGLSEFGRQVVLEMNRVGMMVDMSHAGEKSFYDAVEVSQVPVICSHSSARALCNHPRNLTDDQMKLLARTGGVAQVCMYDGFIKETPGANIHDAVRHIMHMIYVMGIDHVGIGTDMDGGGGLLGLEDASTLVNLTRLLIAQGLSFQDIEKIWGGNFIRVWTDIMKRAGN